MEDDNIYVRYKANQVFPVEEHITLCKKVKMLNKQKCNFFPCLVKGSIDFPSLNYIDIDNLIISHLEKYIGMHK